MEYFIFHASFDAFYFMQNTYWIKLDNQYSLKCQLDYIYSEFNVPTLFESYVVIVVTCLLRPFVQPKLWKSVDDISWAFASAVCWHVPTVEPDTHVVPVMLYLQFKLQLNAGVIYIQVNLWITIVNCSLIALTAPKNFMVARFNQSRRDV